MKLVITPILATGGLAVVVVVVLGAVVSTIATATSNQPNTTNAPQDMTDVGVVPAATQTVPVGGGGSGQAPVGPVTVDEVVSVGGFFVHRSIAGDVRELLADAEADGIVFGGWGWRDHQAQIRLRRQHCGTSEYAVWEMPSSQCSPPTARPGRSQHEYGLAIDFTCNGARIAGTKCHRWLQAHAARYGFFNLPSEAWHWSTTGR